MSKDASGAAPSWTAKGSCLCGDVKFSLLPTSIPGIFKTVAHCHCSMCRKHTGAAFSTYGEVPAEAVVFEGEKEFPPCVVRYTAPENSTIRTFCSSCGSNVMFESPYNHIDGTVELAIALIDEFAEGISCTKSDCHIFVKYKAPWFDITDSLPQFEEYRE